MSRAAYMRDYRAKRKTPAPVSGLDFAVDLARAEDRIRELEAEVARLKRELAARPMAPTERGLPIGARPHEFRPVPKPGKGK